MKSNPIPFLLLVLSSQSLYSEAFVAVVPKSTASILPSTTTSSRILPVEAVASSNEVISSNEPKSTNKLVSAVSQWLSSSLKSSAATSLVVGAALAVAVSTAAPLPAQAASSNKIVGQIAGSGLVFKDTLQIERFDDPKVQGVTLYISNFERPLTERLSSAKNFLSDPAYASVACAKTGSVIKIADNINTTPQGEEVFEESRSIMFKTLRVQRIYDVEKKTVVYVSFNTRIDKSSDDNKSRFKSSLCAVNLEELSPPSVAEASSPP